MENWCFGNTHFYREFQNNSLPLKTNILIFYHSIIFDGLVKSQKTSFFVIPSRIGVRDDGQAGIQSFQKLMTALAPGCSLSRIICGAGATTFYEFVNDYKFKNQAYAGKTCIVLFPCFRSLLSSRLMRIASFISSSSMASSRARVSRSRVAGFSTSTET